MCLLYHLNLFPEAPAIMNTDLLSCTIYDTQTLYADSIKSLNIARAMQNSPPQWEGFLWLPEGRYVIYSSRFVVFN